MYYRVKFASILLLITLRTCSAIPASAESKHLPAPTPMAGPNKPVEWLFVFKFNSATFPRQICEGGDPIVDSKGVFGGTFKPYRKGEHSQNYCFATSREPKLVMGQGCAGGSLNDPLGATFGQVYNTPGYFYVIWNDQFYGEPMETKASPMGHSKGMVAWNDDGEGFVMQVSTPSWPASGSMIHPRKNDGNTLGCVNDDDVEVSQHFFALKINHRDLIEILTALENSSVVTSIDCPEIVKNGGPADVRSIVSTLGKESKSVEISIAKLSTGVRIISKPSKMALPPWQLVSGVLGGVPLRVASWWETPYIYSTTQKTKIEGWPTTIPKPNSVSIATSGTWDGKSIGLRGGQGPSFNHAKIGVSTDNTDPLVIFGDENQQGALWTGYAHAGQTMTSSQNGRGGLFYVVENKRLWESVTELLKGDTAPENPPNGEELPRKRK